MKHYDSGLLAKKKYYIAVTWTVVKTVMRTPRLTSFYPVTLLQNYMITIDKTYITDMFNLFYHVLVRNCEDITKTNVSI